MYVSVYAPQTRNTVLLLLPLLFVCLAPPLVLINTHWLGNTRKDYALKLHFMKVEVDDVMSCLFLFATCMSRELYLVLHLNVYQVKEYCNLNLCG